MEFVKDGKLLGRTGGSWARILGFYAVYYTFLACLIYFTVTKYAENLVQPGGTTPKIFTRQDMPGAAAHPFTGMTVDGDDNYVSLSTDDDFKDSQNNDYDTHMDEFLQTYKDNAEVAKDCTEAGDVAKQCCNIKNFDFLDSKNRVQAVRDQQPYFTVTLNKIRNWEPMSSNAIAGFQGVYRKNSVTAECFESTNDGKRIEDSKFEVKLLGNNQLLSKFYPYHAHDKYADGDKNADFVAYNKPFFVGQVKAVDQDAWKLNVAKKEMSKIFRCEFHATNIQKPLTGEAFYKKASPEQKSWSNDLTKLGIGFVQFGINYADLQ